MANIILHAANQKKGIIIFSHKELIFLEGEYYTSNTPFDKGLKKGFSTVMKPWIRRRNRQYIENLKQKYFIGIHWGWHKTNFMTPNWVDFHLASEGTLTILDDTPILNMASTNFLPDCYLEPLDQKKLYDVATVCRDVTFKGLDEFVTATAKLVNNQEISNVLMIIPEALSQYGKAQSFALREKINANFDSNFLNQVHYLRLSAAGGYLGTNREFVSNLMRQTKVFCLMSQKEGVAKVLNEAQLCGANIVASRFLKGGGLDFMDPNHFYPYDSAENITTSIAEALNGPLRTQSELTLLQERLTQRHSYPKLIEQLGTLLDHSFPAYNENLYLQHNLSRSLPNHFWSPTTSWIKESKGLYRGCDILNNKEIKDFINVAIH
jgi:glycosyltransferase involved in cell wall biosynthesis